MYIYISTVARLPSKGRQVSEGFQNRESVTPIVGGVISYWIDSLKKLKPLWLYDSCRNHQVLFMCFHWSVCEACALHTLILCKQWHHFVKKSTVLACSFSGSDGSGLMLGPKFTHVPSFSIIDYAANPTSDTAYIRVRSRLQHLMVLTDSNLQHMHKNHKHLQQPNRTCTLEASTNWKYLYILENKRELNSKSWLLFTCFHWRQWSIKGFLCEWGHFEKEPLYIISYPFRNTSGTPEWWKLLSTCQATK